MGPRLRIVGINWGQIEPLCWTLALLLVSQKLGSPHELLILFCLDHGVRLQDDVTRTAPGTKLVPGPRREVWVQFSALGR